MALSKITNASIADSTLTTAKLATPNLGRRNIIINGAMQVAQRGTSSTSTGYQTCDRIQFLTNNTDNFAFTVSQSSTAPDGFSTSQKLDCTTAETTLDADELARFLYKVEGQDIQHFNYGSSASEEVTVSFYVRSNVTGVYTVEFRLNASGTSTITKQYTISGANTWERKILKLPKNTVTSVDNDNSNGIELSFCVAAGSNFTTGSLGTSWATTATSSRYAGQAANIMSSTDNEWYITGLQMEVGSQATPFEHRSFGEELDLCHRYYEKTDWNYILGGRYSQDSGVPTATWFYKKNMRVTPTLSTSGSWVSGVGWGGAPLPISIQDNHVSVYSTTEISPNNNIWFSGGTFIQDAEL